MFIRTGEASMMLEPRPTSATEARTFVRSRLAELAVPEPRFQDAVLLTSELVSNAVLHARTEIQVRFASDGQRVRVEVHDGNSRQPAPAGVPADATSGRGLVLVDRLANQWGVSGTATGKAVWFEVNVEAELA